MYQYDKHDQQMVDERSAQFRDQVRRFILGELEEEEFKQLRLRNGLYMQRHAYMLRVAIPYGALSSEQMRTLAHIARTYDRGYGHFSTRQNIQYNWPELEDVPDILDDLAKVEMHAIQTSGNLVRNITSDPLSGVAADELEDPRPYCEILRQWSTFHPEFNWLPRKFKIAVTGAKEDRAAIQWHDIGLQIVENDQGQRGFQVYVGGGMGRTPIVGKEINPFVEAKHLISYIEAILRVYNLLGRRDNIYKARIKILVQSLGVDRFRELVEEEWLRIKDSTDQISEQELAQIKALFRSPNYEILVDQALPTLKDEPEFAHWLKQNTRAHKQAGYQVVMISLKDPKVPPGDITADQMDAVAELADRYSFGQIRSTHDQNLVLSDAKRSDLIALWRDLRALKLATPNIGTLTDMICYPGLDFCSLANAGSIEIAMGLNKKFSNLEQLYDLGKIKLKMSGCMNGCGHHDTGDIGILGVEKQGAEWYQITLGGSASNDAKKGTRIGRAVAKDQVSDVIARILDVYTDNRLPGEEFSTTYSRIGVEPFKERVYEDHSQQTDRQRRPVAAAV